MIEININYSDALSIHQKLILGHSESEIETNKENSPMQYSFPKGTASNLPVIVFSDNIVGL